MSPTGLPSASPNTFLNRRASSGTAPFTGWPLVSTMFPLASVTVSSSQISRKSATPVGKAWPAPTLVTRTTSWRLSTVPSMRAERVALARSSARLSCSRAGFLSPTSWCWAPVKLWR
ncbi:hypothetical protein D3C85_1163910 [compost metagenome]